ncbi:hypothetical protein WKG92_19640 [Pantoea agglomerans]|uniref:hypothetical protein n=1 Tax=Enterobacter agglomerans TaxID=549 RepID=UPI003C7B3E4A
MTTRKASTAELFHNLTMAFRHDPQFQYEYSYPPDTLALITTPYWKLSNEQLAQRLVMIDGGQKESTVENRRVRLMAMRPEHRYLLIPAYVRLAAVTAYADIAPGLSDTPTIAELMPVIWAAVYALDSAREMNTEEWDQLEPGVQSVHAEAVAELFNGQQLSRFTSDAKRAAWLGMFMTFSDTPDTFYQLLVA